MEKTSNHGYNAPTKGTSDWHVPLNENFENFDRDIEVRDTEANRENYQPRQGAKYEAIDTGAVYHGDGSNWVLADRTVRSLSFGEVVSPAPDADLSTFVPEHEGKIIDLGGQLFELEETLILPDNIHIRNGQITDNGSDTSNFARIGANNGLIVDTPPEENRTNITFDNVQFGPRNNAIEGVRIHRPKRLWFKNCYFRQLRWGDALRLVEKNTNNNERGTALLSGCRFENASVTVGEEGVRGPEAIDYVSLVGCSFEDRSSLNLHGENLVVTSTRMNGGWPSSGIYVSGHKCQVENVQIHHAEIAVQAVDAERLKISGLHAMLTGDHAVLLDGVQNSEVCNIFNGRANVSAIRLQATNRDCTNNTIHDCILETYDPSDGTMTPVPIEEVDTGANGNKIYSNNRGNCQSTWDLNSGNVANNTPRVTWDAPPATVENYHVIVATSSWDPNGTGRGALVLTDDGGETWQDIVPLPNS